MRSVADDLREEQIRDEQTMTPEERVELALRLGQRDLELYIATNQLDRATAIAALRRAGRAGRVPSKANDEP
jgi:hypothetical protein